MTTAAVSQSGVEFLFKVTPPARISQAGVEYLHKVQPGIKVSQGGVEYLHRVQPVFAVSQAGVEYLHKAQPCVTQWAQVWTITRTDGAVLRFTSLDRDLPWRGNTYLSCNSLMPSASENSAEAGSVGNIELTGILAAGAVTEQELHSGLYDGAFVEAYLVPWQGLGSVRSLLRGTFGEVRYDGTGFTVEVIGSGARLAQTPLVRVMQPGCRDIFGGPVCQFDTASVTVTGTVEVANGQRGFTDSARGEAAGYFSRGRVTFTSGNNAGITAEIKEHAAGGVFTMWPRLAFGIEVGDTYEMIPGCTNMKESSGGTNGCSAWGNYDFYDGEPYAPGRDAVTKLPDVKK